ncbi:MAG: hypothetical protein O3A00_25740 [Planctomycetota bacterium]|nr:hypothetical protein [Planctomycetota bacterium]
MKGPGFRLDLDIRRKWICPKCGDIRHSGGHFTAQFCTCQDGGTWMALQELPKIHRISLPRPSTPIKFEDEPIEEPVPVIAAPVDVVQDDFVVEIDGGSSEDTQPEVAFAAGLDAEEATPEPASSSELQEPQLDAEIAAAVETQAESVTATPTVATSPDKSSENSDPARRKRRGTRRGRKRRGGGGKSGGANPQSPSPPPTS